MAQRFGEFLVERGIINNKQLEKALHAQLIYGGHLGTCIIELGFAEEDAIGSALAEALGVSYASFELFEGIPAQAIEAIPQALVEKYKAVPLELRDRTLHLAMVDPKNLISLDELSFAAGRRIQPWVAPEVRIFQAMEKYYQIPRRTRYISLCRQLDQRVTQTAKAHAGVAASKPPSGGYGRSRDSFFKSAPTPTSPAALARPSDSPRQVQDSGADAALEELSQLLCRAQDRGMLADAVLKFASRGMARCILFRVKDNLATIWDARGLKLEASHAANVRLPILSEPVLTLLLGDGSFRGSLPEGEKYLGFYDVLAVNPPAELMLLPVYLDDRLIALFYGDNGPAQPLQASTHTFERMMNKLALAVNLVILKRKLHAV